MGVTVMVTVCTVVIKPSLPARSLAWHVKLSVPLKLTLATQRYRQLVERADAVGLRT